MTKKYSILSFTKNNETIPIDYTDAVEEEFDKYVDASINSFLNSITEDVPEEEKEIVMDRFLQDVCFNVTDSSYELVLPSWCKETNGDYDQVAYLVVDKRKKMKTP